MERLPLARPENLIPKTETVMEILTERVSLARPKP